MKDDVSPAEHLGSEVVQNEMEKTPALLKLVSAPGTADASSCCLLVGIGCRRG